MTTPTMRELVFTLHFNEGIDAVSDVLNGRENTVIRSQACHVTKENLWRVDLVNGPTEAQDSIQDAFESEAFCADCLTLSCGSPTDTQVLDTKEDYRVLYVRWTRSNECTSIPHLALEHLGPGLLFETMRTGLDYRWRVLVPEGRSVSSFQSAVAASMDGLGNVSLDLLKRVRGSSEIGAPDLALSPEQRETVTAAFELGYFELPRQITLQELADELNVPRSTVSYRLRRVESMLMDAFLDF